MSPSFVSNSNFMLSFVNKTIEHKTISSDGLTPVKVIWDNNTLKAKHSSGEIYPIHAWDHILGRTTLYSLPTNDAYIPWTEKKDGSGHYSRPETVKQFWGKYKPGMIIRGTIKDGEFYEQDL